MKVAVTARSKDINGETDPRFGRCQFFLIIDPETMEFEAVENFSAMAKGGAGPQATHAISEMGVEVVITGNVGPNAFQALNAAGIKIITGAKGKVSEMIEKFNNGDLNEIEQASVGSHNGIRVKEF
jgi:predicted Fe-Mo cluster-binding NifX family protein